MAEQDADNLALQERAARIAGQLGDIHHDQGRFEKAASSYLQAIARYQQLPDSPAASTDVEIAGLCNCLGTACWAMGQINRGDACYRDALSILEPLPESASASRRYELARIYYAFSRKPEEAMDTKLEAAAPQSKDGSPAKVKETNIRKAASLLQGLVDENPSSTEYREFLSICQHDLQSRPDSPTTGIQ